MVQRLSGFKRAIQAVGSLAQWPARMAVSRRPRHAVSPTLLENLEPRLLLSASPALSAASLAANSLSSFMVGPDRVAIQWQGQTLPALKNSYIVETKNNAPFAPIAAAGGLPVTSISYLGGNGFYEFMNSTLTPDQMSAWGNAHLNQIALIQPNLTNVKPANTYPNQAYLDNTPPFSNFWYLQNTGQLLQSWKDPFSKQIIIDPQFGHAQSIAGNDIAATKAWDLTVGSPNVVVAVIDTGVDIGQALQTDALTPSGRQLLHNLWQNPNAGVYSGDGQNGIVGGVYGANFTDGTGTTMIPDGNIQDYVGHGTFVTGEIGAQANTAYTVGDSNTPVYNPAIGLNWNVKIMTVKALTTTTDPGGNGGAPIFANTDSALIAGIEYVVNEKQIYGVNVAAINMSIGEYIPGTNINNTNPSDPFGSNLVGVQVALQQAVGAGIIPVIAAGNAGLNVNNFAFVPANVGNGVITVAATDNQGQLASFSNYGPNTVSLGAPGVDIPGISAPLGGTGQTGGMTLDSGTSMAAPLVTGTIALEDAAYGFYHNNQPAPVQALRNALIAGLVPNPNLASKTIYGGELNTYNAVENIIGGAAPYGHVDNLNAGQVSGWAFSPKTGNQPINVFVNIDGRTVLNAVANIARPDLGTDSIVFGTNHGFSFIMPNLPVGLHQVQVYAVDNTYGTSTLLGSGVVNGAVPPIGHVDVANATVISGWAGQRVNGANPSTVQIYVDGHQTASVTANLARPDLVPVLGSANHGFSYQLPTLTPGLHRVDVYILDNQTNQPVLLQSLDVNNDITPIGAVDPVVGSVITGWVYDAAASATPIDVSIAVDGTPGPVFAANLSRPDIASVTGSNTSHGFSYTLPALSGGPHTISVYAIDPNNNLPFLISSFSVNNQTPIGSLDTVSTSQVTGWAYDPNASTGSTYVSVNIDGQQGLPFIASVQRPDLLTDPAVASSAHGYVYNLPALSAGSHNIAVYAYDSTTDVPTLIGQQTLTVPDFGGASKKPFGRVDVVSANSVVGWAFDPNSGAAPINVQVTVDGATIATAPANVYRPDLQAYLGSTGHGFSVPLGNLSAGTHYVQVFALDDQTGQPILIGSGFVNQQPVSGTIEVANPANVSGVLYNPTSSSTPPDVRIDIAGVPGSVVPTVAAATGQGSGGTANNYTFAETLPGLTAGPHLVQLFSVDPVSLQPTLLAEQNVYGFTPPVGHVDVFNSSLISGWAFDPNSGSYPVNISVSIDGAPDAIRVANLARPDLVGFLGSANHGFSFSLAGIAPSGVHTVTISMLNPLTDQPVVLYSQTLTFA